MSYFSANEIFDNEHFQQQQQQTILKSANKATFPADESYIVKKTIVVDSRQRNCSKYPSPSFYRIEFGDVYKNITSVELIGAIIPKSSYNIHSSNNKIDFSIGDFVTSFKIIKGGSGYTAPPTIIVSDPTFGITATGTAFIDSFGRLSNVLVGIPGSGYLTSKPPFVYVSNPQTGNDYPVVAAIVGYIYTATLRPGQYVIGGNPIPGSTVVPSDLLLEIQNAMNYAVNGGIYDPVSVSPFAIRLTSQYPMLGAVPGTPEYYDTNASLFNRIQLININSDHWELLFCSGPSKEESANSVLGFNINDNYDTYITGNIMVGPDVLIPGGSSIRANFDYNLNDDPDYVIMELRGGDVSYERIESKDNGGIDRKFAILIFDNNNPDCLQDLSGTTTIVGGVQYLEGSVTKGTFWKDPGKLKPLKGYDFDSKKISFRPAEGKLSSLTVSFTKYGLKAGGSPQMYQFEGREHTLIFEVSAQDQYSKQKD